MELSENNIDQAPRDVVQEEGVNGEPHQLAEACSPRQGVEAQHEKADNALSDYNLVRVRKRRVPKPTQRFDMILLPMPS